MHLVPHYKRQRRQLDERGPWDAGDIVQYFGNMSARPEFYSGNGAMVSNLCSEQLQLIYMGIEKYHGKCAATNFAQMVADLEKLTASGFLRSLYELERNGWRWEHVENKPVSNIALDGYGEQLEACAFATVVSAFGNGDVDQTDYIRREFLGLHKDELIRPVKPKPTMSGNYYS
jgi:hypothetical protein